MFTWAGDLLTEYDESTRYSRVAAPTIRGLNEAQAAAYVGLGITLFRAVGPLNRPGNSGDFVV